MLRLYKKWSSIIHLILFILAAFSVSHFWRGLHFCILVVINIVYNVINMVVFIILIIIEEEEKLCGWRDLTFKPHYSDSGRSYKSPCGAAAAAKNYPICISTDTIINIIINSIIIINDDHYDHHHHC